jgi:hypothetical protein
MDLTYGMIALIAGIILVIAGQAFVKKVGTRKTATWIGVILIGVFLLGTYVMPTQLAFLGTTLGGTTLAISPQTQATQTQIGTMGQNPTVNFVFVDALTQQSVTASATNVKDASTGALLGATSISTTNVAQGQQIIALVNGSSSYIAQVQPTYTVVAGNQQLQGKLYGFQNVTVQLYNNAGTGLIGGANSATNIGSVGNDSISSSIINNKILLTGNTFKSSGRLMIIDEFDQTANISSVTLTQLGSNTPIAQVPVPNCYANTLGGTPNRVAWEIPAVVNGVQIAYNLQTVSANGNKLQGARYINFYAEKDAVDSLTGAFLTSGICDSNNVATSINDNIQSFYYK